MGRPLPAPTHLSHSLPHRTPLTTTHLTLPAPLNTSHSPPLPHPHRQPCITLSSIPSPPITRPPPHFHRLPTSTPHTPPHSHSSLHLTQLPPDFLIQVSVVQLPHPGMFNHPLTTTPHHHPSPPSYTPQTSRTPNKNDLPPLLCLPQVGVALPQLQTRNTGLASSHVFCVAV